MNRKLSMYTILCRLYVLQAHICTVKNLYCQKLLRCNYELPDLSLVRDLRLKKKKEKKSHSYYRDTFTMFLWNDK